MSTGPAPIQFESAEYGQGPSAPGGVTCAACKLPIVDQYFEAASQVLCGNCAAILKAGPQGGSRIWRTIEALIGGLMGGVLGAIPYFLILKFTGYEIGLIAIVVGVFVGLGVKRGARGRGGWFYQMMAIGITYLAVVSTYVPLLITGYEENSIQEHNAVNQSGRPSTKVSVLQDGRVLVDTAEATSEEWHTALDSVKEKQGVILYYREGRTDGAEAPPIADEVADAIRERQLDRLHFQDAEFTQPLYESLDAPGMTLGRRCLMVATFFILAIAFPFITIKDNFLGLVIIAIALWEAWKINKKPVPVINGPFVLSPSGAIGQGSIVHVPPPISLPTSPPSFDEPTQGPTPS